MIRIRTCRIQDSHNINGRILRREPSYGLGLHDFFLDTHAHAFYYYRTQIPFEESLA